MTETTKTLWLNEGGSLVTPLIRMLAKHDATSLDIDDEDELAQASEKAFSLVEEFDDWAGAARAAGWSYLPEDGVVNGGPDKTEFFGDDAWRRACEHDGIEPLRKSVEEHWVVSDWLSQHLAVRGEKVVPGLAGMTIWAKSSVGPVLDHPVIAEIAEIYEPAVEDSPTPGLR